jgi:hypothetical protein
MNKDCRGIIKSNIFTTDLLVWLIKNVDTETKFNPTKIEDEDDSHKQSPTTPVQPYGHFAFKYNQRKRHIFYSISTLDLLKEENPTLTIDSEHYMEIEMNADPDSVDLIKRILNVFGGYILDEREQTEFLLIKDTPKPSFENPFEL